MSRTKRPAASDPREGVVGRRDVVTATVALAAGVLVLAGVLVGAGSRPETAAPVIAEPIVTGMINQAGLIVEGSVIDLGVVPLDTTVTPTWTITNASAQTVSLGEAHASVIEGCCPGPLMYSDTVLEPGESVLLTFPLQMHPGMDGPHDFDVHVPYGDGPDDYLTLRVVGNFNS
jgi:hypothetical protein